jgi:hypothetical protein
MADGGQTAGPLKKYMGEKPIMRPSTVPTAANHRFRSTFFKAITVAMIT